MVAHQLRATLSVLALDDLEELRHAPGVVSGVVQHVRSKQVGLFFRVTRHLQKAEAGHCTDALRRQSSGPAAQQNTCGNLPDTGKHARRALFGQIAGGVAQHHM